MVSLSTRPGHLLEEPKLPDEMKRNDTPGSLRISFVNLKGSLWAAFLGWAGGRAALLCLGISMAKALGGFPSQISELL